MSRYSLIALLIAPAVAAQVPTTQKPAPLSFDSTTIRTLLAEGVTAARKAPVAERSSLFAALGRTQVTARDYAGAARTLRLVDDESPVGVMRQLGQPAEFAGLERAGLARRLSCGLHDDERPDDALAVIRGMRPGEDRDWELAHEAVIVARGATPPSAKQRSITDARTRGREALDIARGIAFPAARLDALVAIAGAMPDTGSGRVVLERAYTEARRITLSDADRQRSRDAMLATVALELDRTNDVRTLFARLTDIADLRLVIGTAATRANAAPLVRELAPRAIASGRAIGDSAAREDYLTHLWSILRQSGGRAFADSLLPESTYAAEHPRDISAMLDSAAKADPTPVAMAERAVADSQWAMARVALARIPLGDREARRASAWVELAHDTYGMHRDSARAYLHEARIALLASRADSATFDDVATSIAQEQFWLGDHDEGVTTLDLVRDARSAGYVISQWGTSTFSGLDAHRLRGYADRFRNSLLRDLVLERVINPYLTGKTNTAADRVWARALADSITTPAVRRSALRGIANSALVGGDSVGARRQLLALLSEPDLTPEEIRDDWGRGLLGDLVRAGAWREAVAWARVVSAPADRARYLMSIATQLQRVLDARTNRGLMLSNGPDWCRDEF